jgi:membrane protein YdbS with pleckstrin-like domain
MNLSSLIKQKSYEKVEYILHRHPITFIPYILLFIILMLVPVALYFLITNLFPSFLESQTVFPLSVLCASLYYLSVYLFFYAQFIDYYLDVWIVTNDRVVDIEQFGLFSRTISEVDLFRIQDVTSDVHGFFATLFKYGNVSIKTASANLNIVAQNIKEPNKIREELVRLSDEDRKYHYKDQ